MSDNSNWGYFIARHVEPTCQQLYPHDQSAQRSCLVGVFDGSGIQNKQKGTCQVLAGQRGATDKAAYMTACENVYQQISQGSFQKYLQGQ